MNEKLLSLQELAEELNVPVSWCYSRSRQRGPNAMPRLNCGKYVRVRSSEVLAWLEKQNPQNESPVQREFTMNTEEKLKKMRAKRAENIRLGIKPLNPIEKAKQNPNSMRFAINAQCYDCMGKEAGWRNEVRNCPSSECPLYGLRPYK